MGRPFARPPFQILSTTDPLVARSTRKYPGLTRWINDEAGELRHLTCLRQKIGWESPEPPRPARRPGPSAPVGWVIATAMLGSALSGVCILIFTACLTEALESPADLRSPSD